MRFRPSFVVVAVLLFAFAWNGSARAQDLGSRPPERRIFLPPPILEGDAGGRELAEPFAATLRSSFASAAEARGFAVAALPGSPRDPAAEARNFNEDWYGRIFAEVRNDRLSYRIEVFSSWSGDLVAADSFSAYAGPTAFPLIDDSAARVAERLAAYVAAPEDSPRRPVSYRITILSPDEGARITIGPPELRLSIRAGEIKNGKLTLPYYPFARGSTVRLYLSQPGRRTEILRIHLGEAAPVVSAPPLEAQSYQDLIVGTGSGRLLGIQAGYRRYIVPQWIFLFADDHLFAGYDFLPGSSPFLHEELWTGVGSYLVLGPESRFRFGAQAGLGYLFSYSTVPEAQRRLYFDLALLPVYLFCEYSLSRKAALWMSLSSAFSLGTGSSGILGREWMGDGVPALGAGVVWRI
ncbi:MAG TPA: hypothetical protein VMV90_09645 [Rectinemataceae bacterium]|nr:hypothetical protein [Rectinemataceae bacterium]